MATFDLAAAIGLRKVSNLDTEKTERIALDLIDPNPKNFFEVEENVTDLAESIKLNGLLQPPVVAPSGDGRYRLIAGHRRHKALVALAAEEPGKYASVMCRIVRPASDEMEELMLIQTNTEARTLGWHEKAEAAKRTEKILLALKNQGVSLPGKMRKHVAEIIKASESQIARAKFIDKNLIAPLKADHCIADNLAYRLAHLPPEQQEDLRAHFEGKTILLTGAAVDRYEENIRLGRDPFYMPPREEPPLHKTPEAVASAPQEVSKAADSRWYRYLFQDYTPTDGELFLLLLSDNILPEIIREKVCRWRDGRFVLASNERCRPMENLIAFLPLPEPPKGFTLSITGGDGNG